MHMRHKITVYEQVEKRGLFGRKKTVTVARKVYVDGKTYRRMRREDIRKAREEEERARERYWDREEEYDILDGEE